MNNENLLVFLLSSFFNLSLEDINENNQETIIQICCNRAYLDMCRTLRFNDDITQQQRTGWKEILTSVISQSINQFIHNQEQFDDIHQSVCNTLIECANRDGFLRVDFEYGQAQKWLNMTLKYAFLLHVFDGLEGFERRLHVTIDRYIILVATDNENVNEYALGINRNLFPENSSWSRWNNHDYLTAQALIRNGINSYNNNNSTELTPFMWELFAWIVQAQIENQ